MLSDLKETSAVAVHFIRPDEIETTLNIPEFSVMEGSVGDVKTDKELFAVVASSMQFPDYFGNNWDALDDCLMDMEYWLPADGYLLILRDAAKGWSQCPYVLGRFVETWLLASERWAEQKKPFHLIFIM